MLAHAGIHPAVHVVAFDWYPEVLFVVLICAALYLYAVGPLRQRHGLAPRVERRHVACFLAGLFAVYLAEGTPLHTLAERYLFSAHMLQHILLTMVLPPLLLLGTPDWLVRHLLRARWIAGAARFATRPLVALVAFNAVNALWHLPAFYQAPLLDHWLHPIQHATLVGTALLMWWPLLSPVNELPRLHDGVQVLYVFGVLLVQMPVFAPIAFAYAPIYQFYADAPRIWGISPLTDQQIAGLVMKLLGMAILILAMGVAFFRWAKQDAAWSPKDRLPRSKLSGRPAR